MQKKLPKIVVILGPTASGKSSWGLRLSKKFSGYIISADSRQIYCQMDIGTNKPPSPPSPCPQGEGDIAKNQQIICFENIPHYMIDIINPNDDYNVAQYQAEVKQIIKANQPQIPFLVGGTGLYIQSIIDNLIIPEVPPDAKIRAKLELQTNEQLFNQLKKLDPVCVKKIDAKNRRRLIRALEVCLKTGQPFSQLRQKGKPLFDTLQIGINVPKKELDQRIDQRVDEMIKQGLIDEVKKLLEVRRKPDNSIGVRLSPDLQPIPNPQLPAFSGIGYQEIIQYLQNKISSEQAIKLIKLHTKQYAKRQMTWFKRDPRIRWATEYAEAEKLVKTFLGK